MIRLRAIALIGLVLGLTGCAETHQCVISRPIVGPGVSPGLAATSPCQSCTIQPSAVAAATTPAPPPTTWGSATAPAPTRVATTATKPRIPSWTTEPEPDPTRPVPVPAPTSTSTPETRPAPKAIPRHPALAPPPTRLVRYLPLFDDRQTRPESLWDFSPPDPFGVRTAIANEDQKNTAAMLSRRQPTPGPFGAVPLSYESPVPTERRKSLISRMFSNLSSRVSAVTPQRPISEPRTKRETDVIPASAVIATPRTSGDPNASGPILDVGLYSQTVFGLSKPAESKEKSINLEYASDNAPKNPPQTTTTAIQARRNAKKAESSKAQAKAESPRNWSLFPVAKTDSKPAGPPKETPVGRFMRRLQGASQAFLDPDSVRRKANDLPQGGESVQRVSAERIDETPKR